MNNEIIENIIKDDFMLQQIINLHKREFKLILFRDHSLKYVACEKFRNAIIKLKNILNTTITMYGPHIIQKKQINSLCEISKLIINPNKHVLKYLNYLPNGIKYIYIKNTHNYIDTFVCFVKNKNKKIKIKIRNECDVLKIKVIITNLPSSVEKLYINNN